MRMKWWRSKSSSSSALLGIKVWLRRVFKSLKLRHSPQVFFWVSWNEPVPLIHSKYLKGEKGNSLETCNRYIFFRRISTQVFSLTNLFKVFLSTEVIPPFSTCFLLICLLTTQHRESSMRKETRDVQRLYRFICRGGVTSIVVVLPATKEMCMIKKPITLKANAKFKTVAHDGSKQRWGW